MGAGLCETGAVAGAAAGVGRTATGAAAAVCVVVIRVAVVRAAIRGAAGAAFTALCRTTRFALGAGVDVALSAADVLDWAALVSVVDGVASVVGAG